MYEQNWVLIFLPGQLGGWTKIRPGLSFAAWWQDILQAERFKIRI